MNRLDLDKSLGHLLHPASLSTVLCTYWFSKNTKTGPAYWQWCKYSDITHVVNEIFDKISE